MFCTNCGEEMRAIDKFCANCGAAAAPRPAKTRTAASTAAESPAPPRALQSTAEAFHVPLPTPPVSPAAPPPPLSRQQEQQVLLEAEEIASVRGMSPAEALPADFPPAAPAPAIRIVQTQTCASCGETNPAGNRFCERCGKPLQAAAPVQCAPAPAPVRMPPPSPITQTSWLDQPEPAPPAVTAPVVAKAVPAPLPSSTALKGRDEDFFYFYDDASSQRSNRKLIIVLMVVLALGVLGVIYLLSRPSAKRAVPANLTITIAPTETEVAVGEAHDFSATVGGSGDTDVAWSVAEGSAGGTVVSRGAQADGGAVASMGVYVAPTTPGTYHVVATSKADTSKSATAEVLVSGK
ncbi:MAG: zinc-ribbon domain-containing protein [Acidobacteriota bacterium]|nr:zinc-ribbon domain-containing protein [Acidobacteriota bacterium]